MAPELPGAGAFTRWAVEPEYQAKPTRSSRVKIEGNPENQVNPGRLGRPALSERPSEASRTWLTTPLSTPDSGETLRSPVWARCSTCRSNPEFKDSYLTYAMSTIMDRPCPMSVTACCRSAASPWR